MSNLLRRPLGGGGSGATIGAGDVGVNVQLNVNQAAHNFSIGNLLYYTGSGLALAQADSASTLAVGIVVTVTDVDNFVFVLFGQASVGAILDDDSNGLTGGVIYYLSETIAGSFTPIAPTGVSNYVQPVFEVTETNSVIIVNPKLAVQGAP